MARYRGQKALYEVIGGSQPKPKARGRQLVETLHARPEPKEEKTEPTEPSQVSAHNEQIRWEPRAIQFNSGRVELVLPYPVVFVLALTVLVAILAAFKFGQYSGAGSGSRQSPDPGQKNAQPGGNPKMQGAVSSPTANEDAPKADIEQTPFDTTVRPGNAIVIQEHRVLEDLVPVKQFFDDMGIATEVVSTADTFFLITKQRFAGAPDKEGSPGYLLERQIGELGKKYQAPPDRAIFAGFDGAYGMYFSGQFQGEVVNVN